MCTKRCSSAIRVLTERAQRLHLSTTALQHDAECSAMSCADKKSGEVSWSKEHDYAVWVIAPSHPRLGFAYAWGLHHEGNNGAREFYAEFYRSRALR